MRAPRLELLLLAGVLLWGQARGAGATPEGPVSAAEFAVLDVRAERQGPAQVPQTNCFVVVLVDAVGLDFSTADRFFETLARHPRTPKRDHSVGHAWLVLGGPSFWLECGHTGEIGLDDPGYRQLALAAVGRGLTNPIACLWAERQDGALQLGSGDHKPTTAVRFELSLAQYQAIRQMIENYDYQRFSLRERVCTHFVAAAAALGGVRLGHCATVSIPRQSRFHGRLVTWWTEPQFARLSFGSPDVLERSLKLAVQQGLGTDVLALYRN